MKSESIDDLLRDGFSRKFASYYLDLAQREYDNPAYTKDFVRWSHARGFLAESAAAYGLTDANASGYLSDYDYYRIWPVNSWARIWINDKLTLKYMLDGTEFSELMPKYYFYTTPGGLRKLVDAPYQDRNPAIEEFKAVLSEVGEFACKPCNGATSIGFFRMSCDGGRILVNGEELGEGGLDEFLFQRPNYVFTEYLRPSRQFRGYSHLIHTLRMVTVNEGGNEPRIIGGYLRIPNSLSGEANYIIIDKDNLEKYNVVVDVDFDTGAYGPGKLTYADRAIAAKTHPDNGKPLSGSIEGYETLREAVLGVARRFSTIEYMGFDIGITDEGFKCMEINSHPGIKYMQVFAPLLADDRTREYFGRKVREVDGLSDVEKAKRNGIVR